MPLSFRNWLTWLLDPTTPGAGPQAPALQLRAFLVCWALLAAQVVARYRFDVLFEEHWLGVHVAFGLTLHLAVLRGLLGPAAFAAIDRRARLLGAVALLLLLAFWYGGRIDSWYRWFQGRVGVGQPLEPLWPFFYFSANSLIWRLILPATLAIALLGYRPRDLGLQPAPRIGSAST